MIYIYIYSNIGFTYITPVSIYPFQIICFQNQDPYISREDEEQDEPRLLPEDLTLLDIENQVGSTDAELVLYYTLRQAKGPGTVGSVGGYYGGERRYK